MEQNVHTELMYLIRHYIKIYLNERASSEELEALAELIKVALETKNAL